MDILLVVVFSCCVSKELDGKNSANECNASLLASYPTSAAYFSNYFAKIQQTDEIFRTSFKKSVKNQEPAAGYTDKNTTFATTSIEQKNTMEQFEVHILGCGSALPTTRHNASSQIIRVGNELFMIDCGEGTQLQIRKSHQHFSRINNIFISHLHGDHCFGLIGMISTFGLLGRKHPLHIHAHPMLRTILTPQIEYFCQGMKYEVILHDINPKANDIIYEDKNVTVETLPLNHRIPCCGFLISEKPKKRHLRGEMAEYYNIPTYARQKIRDGEDYITPEGEIIANGRLTTPPNPSRKYAYCSDTTPSPPGLAERIKGADLLYHEATFAESESLRAKETFHSTAQQAATVALEAEVKRLAIGHFSSRYDDESILLQEAQSVFSETILARENLVIKI